jgi:hypothetical protein
MALNCIARKHIYLDMISDNDTSKIEITPEMIEAGASILLDGTEWTAHFSRGDAEDYAEMILKAALAVASSGRPKADPRRRERP